jgi:hypothetical protein
MSNHHTPSGDEWIHSSQDITYAMPPERSLLGFAPLVLTSIILSYLFINSLVPAAQTKYYSFFLILLAAIFVLITRELHAPREPILILYLVAQTIAFLPHVLNGPSATNVLTTTICFVGVYLATTKTLRRCGIERTEKLIYVLLLGSVFLMIPFSTLLTAIHFPSAPDIYFWQASPVNGDRMTLMRGKNGAGLPIGDSDVVWTMGLAMLLNEKFRRGVPVLTFRWAFHIFVIGLGVVLLVLTGTRVALLFIVEAFLLFLSYRKLLGVKFFALINVALFTFYLIIALSPAATILVGSYANELQRSIPFVRITNANPEASIASSRGVLNVRLVEEANRSPLIGQGHDNPVLTYGVSSGGSIAAGQAEVAALVESGLRLATAYGYPYFFLQVIFLGWPMILAIRRRGVDPKLACAVSGGALMTFIVDGAFENWFWDHCTILLGIMIIIYGIEPAQEFVDDDESAFLSDPEPASVP